MPAKTRIPRKRIGRLIARSLAHMGRAKSNFTLASAAIDKAIEMGAPFGEPFEGPDGRRYVIADNFADKSVLYRPARFPRFTIEPWKEPSQTSRRPVESGAVQP
jgi:hypothetical protein